MAKMAPLPSVCGWVIWYASPKVYYNLQKPIIHKSIIMRNLIVIMSMIDDLTSHSHESLHRFLHLFFLHAQVPSQRKKKNTNPNEKQWKPLNKDRKGGKNLNVQKRDVSTHFQHQDSRAFSYPVFNIKFRQYNESISKQNKT